MDAAIARIPASTDSIPASVITDIHKIRGTARYGQTLTNSVRSGSSWVARRTLLALPYEIVIEIAELVATTSPHPMENLCSLHGTYVFTVHPRMSRITYIFNLSSCTVRVSL